MTAATKTEQVLVRVPLPADVVAFIAAEYPTMAPRTVLAAIIERIFRNDAQLWVASQRWKSLASTDTTALVEQSLDARVAEFIDNA